MFRSAIMDSGTVLSSWAYSKPEAALKKAKKLGDSLKCKAKNSTKLLLCLQNVTAEVLAEKQQQILGVQVPSSSLFKINRNFHG